MTLLQRHNKWTLVYSKDGKRHWWATGEASKPEATKKAKTFLKSLRDNGFDETVSSLSKRKNRMSLGAIIKWYEAEPIDVRPRTKKHNVWALKQIIRECNLDEAADSSLLGEQAVKTWQLSRLNRLSANSLLRQARSVVAHQCPVVPPGLLVRPLKADKPLYEAPAQEVIVRLLQASETWPVEVRLAWTMATQLGLRASEITHARKSWIGDTSFVVKTEPDFAPKSRQSRALPLSPETRQFLNDHSGPDYILPGATQTHRNNIIRALNLAMRNAGWQRRMKAHELRKYFGSQVAMQAGIWAASRLLGHNSVKVTEDSYGALLGLPSLVLVG